MMSIGKLRSFALLMMCSRDTYVVLFAVVFALIAHPAVARMAAGALFVVTVRWLIRADETLRLRRILLRFVPAIAIAMMLYIMNPTSVFACSGIIDCAFGWSERAEISADRDAEIARIEADRDRAIADAQAEQQRVMAAAEAQQQQVVEQARAEVERIRQQQFATEAERDVAIAQAEAMRDQAIAETQRKADEYRTMITALTSEKLAGINSNTETQIAALQGTAQIAIAGVTEAGNAERWRIGGGWIFSIVAVFIVGVLVAQWQKQRHEQLTIRLLEGGNYYNPHQLPQAHRQLPQRRVMIVQRGNKQEIVRYE